MGFVISVLLGFAVVVFVCTAAFGVYIAVMTPDEQVPYLKRRQRAFYRLGWTVIIGSSATVFLVILYFIGRFFYSLLGTG